jgi:dynein light chain roadblock-type
MQGPTTPGQNIATTSGIKHHHIKLSEWLNPHWYLVKRILRYFVRLIKGQTNGHDALEEKLGRLSKKPGVKASIVLDRATGAILKTSGQVDALQTSKTRTTSTATSFSNEAPALEESKTKGVEQFAAIVWNYVNSSGSLVQELDGEVRIITGVTGS